MAERGPSELSARLECGALAGPLFVAAFTAIGARRPAYDSRRHTVSSLAVGYRGWLQQANFIVAGVLYSYAAQGLCRCPRRSVGPRVVPALIAAAGVGLIGSGVFVTDPMGDFPPVTPMADGPDDDSLAEPAPTREGKLHNVCAIPIFAGIPLAELASAVVAARRGDYRWASYSAASSVAMVGSFMLMGMAFGGVPRFAGKGGLFQRISIASGFGRLTALSLRALSSLPHN
ncbi:MAG: DUF998 domain-containing protein [Acidimicrobiia bacterium]